MEFNASTKNQGQEERLDRTNSNFSDIKGANDANKLDYSFRGIPLIDSFMTDKPIDLNPDNEESLCLEGDRSQIIGGPYDSPSFLKLSPRDNKYSSFMLDDHELEGLGLRSPDKIGKDKKPVETFDEERKNSFNKTKEWENERETLLNMHRSIIENILTFLIQRITISQDGFTQIIRCFQARATQELAYFKAIGGPLLKLGSLFQDGNKDDKSTWTLPQALKLCDQYHIEHMMKSKRSSDFIEFKVLGEIVLPAKKKIDDEIRSKFLLLNTIRNELNIQNEKTSKSTKDYAYCFTQKGKTQEDIFVKELSFYTNASFQMELQEKLGKFVAENFMQIKDLEVRTYNIVKDSFRIYTKKLEEIYGKSKIPDEIEKILEIFDSGTEQDKIFDLDRVLNAESKKSLGNLYPNITTENLIKYLSEFQYPLPKSCPLAIHEAKGAYEKDGKIIGMTSCSLVITVDRNLVCYEFRSQFHDFIIHRIVPINIITLKSIQPNNSCLEFVENRKAFIGTNQTHIRVTFQDKTARDDFVSALEKLLE